MKKKMKKRHLILIIFMIFFVYFFTFPLIKADISEEGYDCLEEKIDDKSCSELSLDELIFSVLSTGKCKEELASLSQNKSNGECFGSGNVCSVKQTAQASLALKEAGYNIRPYISWLLTQKKHENSLDWFLQIQTDEGTNCSISNDKGSFNISVGDFKKLRTSETHSCFSLDDSKYRIKFERSCVDKEFQVICNNPFSISLMFETASVWNILDKTETLSSGENYTGMIDSYCFKESERRDECNYGSTLWTSLIFSVEGESFSSYLPYLVGLRERKSEFIPDSFLYYMTGNWNYYSSVLVLQNPRRGFWRESGNEYYDTAVALFPFPNNQNLTAKDNATTWLEKVQGDEGCWNNGDIKDTAFLLFSIWPQILDIPENDNRSYCRDEGYYCMSNADCSKAEGEVVNGSLCSGLDICCTQPRPIPTCQEAGGIFCSEDKVCSKNVLRDISNYDSDKICCTGDCINESEKVEPEPTTSECEDFGGACRDSCSSDEELNLDFSCIGSSKKCCMPEDKDSSLFIWIIILIIIIGLGVLGYFYRNKIKVFIKEKFGKGKKISNQRRGLRRPSGRTLRKPMKSSQPSNEASKTPKNRTSKPTKQKPSQSKPQKTQQKQTQKSQEEEEDPFKKLKGESKGEEEDPFKKLKELEEKSKK